MVSAWKSAAHGDEEWIDLAGDQLLLAHHRFKRFHPQTKISEKIFTIIYIKHEIFASNLEFRSNYVTLCDSSIMALHHILFVALVDRIQKMSNMTKLVLLDSLLQEVKVDATIQTPIFM